MNEFNEPDYLALYPDDAAAVKAGAFKSGYEHYHKHGKAEGRQTLAISLLLARWVLPSVGIEDKAEALRHLVGVLVPVVTSCFGHKLITFK